MYRIITVEREYGCGGGEIARELSQRLGWKLWDHTLTEEIAKLANVQCSEVERCEERVDSTFYRMAKVFWRGSNERSMALPGSRNFDADQMVEIGQRVMEDAAKAGKCVIVGRGAPYFLRQQPNAFHVFLYACRSEKLRRILALGKSEGEANELLDTVDSDRIDFIKHYFDADWPSRWLYHVMINTAIGNENVISTILNTMNILEHDGSKPTLAKFCEPTIAKR
ncbi:MAG: AAA family ATPase [Terriglobales bacterium]